MNIPTLGCTAVEIYRRWEEARIPLMNVVGLIVGYGVFFWYRGKLCRAFRYTRTAPATYELCTQDQLAEIDRAIKSGWIQIIAQPPTGLLYGKGTYRDTGPDPHQLGIIVLHQATGKPLQEAA